MSIILDKQSRSRYPKRRVVSLDELSSKSLGGLPLAEGPINQAVAKSQVRFGQEKGLDWQAAEADPLAYLRVDRRRPVAKEKSFVQLPEVYTL